MKKILTALLLTAAASTTASANMTGLYVGVAGITGATTAKYTDVPGVANSAAGPTFRMDSGKTSFGGRLEVGYGMTFSGCGWFGVSIYATALNTKMVLNDSLGNPGSVTVPATASMAYSRATLKNKFNYGAEFKLGYHFTKDTVGFIGIAAEAGKYRLDWTQNTFNTKASVTLRPTLRASKTKVYAKPVIGVRTTGLGGNRNLFLEAKYGYGFANKVTLSVPVDALGATTAASTQGRTVSARPRTHEFSVTIGWRF